MIRPVRASEVAGRFPQLITATAGNLLATLDSIQIPSEAKPNAIVFVVDPKFTDMALSSPAAAVVLSVKAKAAIEALPPSDKAFLFSPNVKLAMALIKKEFFTFETPLQDLGTVHPSALVDPTARIGAGVTIGPFCVVGKNVVIEDGARLDAHVVIEADAQIGKDSHLQSHLYIGPRTEIGQRCLLMPNSTIGSEGFGFAPDERGRFHRIPQTGKVVLENDVEIGANCTVDRATFGVTRIGEGTKIDKISHIAHNCDIGKHCVMAGKFAIAGSGKVGDHCMIGGRVTIKDGVTVASKVEIAGLAGVQSDIKESGAYGGFPVQPVRDFMRTGASLPYLPQLRKDVARVLKHLGLGAAD